MSAEALQQVAVRLHHDPAFVQAVYADPAGSLADEDLSSHERSLLLAVDQRAWLSDPERQSRVLEALRTEFPCTAAWMELHGTNRQTFLDFFSSDTFHSAIRDQEVLAIAFGTFLESAAEGWAPRAADLAALETDFARARRLPAAGTGRAQGVVAAASPDWVQAPHIRLRRSPVGSLSLLEGLRRWLASDLRGEAPTEAPPGPACEWLCVEHVGDGELRTGTLPEALGELLDFCRRPQPHEAVLAEFVRLGCDETEATEVLEELLSDGLLTLTAAG